MKSWLEIPSRTPQTRALPDRMATQLTNTPQLTRFDDNEASLDLGADQENNEGKSKKSIPS